MIGHRSPPIDNIAELLLVLDGLAPLLRELEEPQWADWIERARRLIAGSDFAGVEVLLRAYGGMGSFNDIAGNRRLRELRSRAFDLAKSIERTSG